MNSQPLMTLSDWFGLATVASVVIVGAFVALWGTHRAGKQKTAESRLEWNARYRMLAIQLYDLLHELERLRQRNRQSLRRLRLEASARTVTVELLLMINPDSDDPAAPDEREVENDCLERLARLGIGIDMGLVRKHRFVVKHAWQRAKREF
jgi:hypothetical protein